MKRKTYVKPLLNSEEFVPQEYVAACWIVECDVPLGNGYYETNNRPGCQTKSGRDWHGKYAADERVMPYVEDVRGCGSKHQGVMSQNKPTYNCYWVKRHGKAPENFNCFHWYQQVGHGHYPDHFSTLNWEPVTNPNAS